MSATHDSVFKMGTRRPGTLLRAFPRASVARGVTPLSQPRRARPPCGRRVLPPLRVRAYRACSVARGFPGRTRTDRTIRAGCVHRRHPRLSPAEAGSSRGSPRWSRPASPRRVNERGSVDGQEHLPLPVRRWFPDVRGLHSRELLQCSLVNRPWAQLRLRSRRGCAGARGSSANGGSWLRSPEGPPSPRPGTLVTDPRPPRPGRPRRPSRRSRRSEPTGPFPPGTFPHRPAPGRSRAHRPSPRTDSEMPLGPSDRGPMTWATPYPRARRGTLSRGPVFRVAAPRWLLRPKTRKLVFATFEN